MYINLISICIQLWFLYVYKCGFYMRMIEITVCIQLWLPHVYKCNFHMISTRLLYVYNCDYRMYKIVSTVCIWLRWRYVHSETYIKQSQPRLTEERCITRGRGCVITVCMHIIYVYEILIHACVDCDRWMYIIHAVIIIIYIQWNIIWYFTFSVSHPFFWVSTPAPHVSSGWGNCDHQNFRIAIYTRIYHNLIWIWHIHTLWTISDIYIHYEQSLLRGALDARIATIAISDVVFVPLNSAEQKDQWLGPTHSSSRNYLSTICSARGGTACCVSNVMQSQSPISKSLVSLQRNVAKDT